MNSEIVKTEGKAYYFSHETIQKIESNQLKFINADGEKLIPKYFGAGLHGINGTLQALRSEQS